MPKSLFANRQLSSDLSPLEQKQVCFYLPLKFKMNINNVKIKTNVACVKIWNTGTST